MKTLADQFAEILAPAGARPIYGIVGDSLNGLTDALRRQGRIEWVHVRHEEGFHCQRHDACNDRTADYDKDPPQAALLNKHQTNRQGTHAESRAKQTSDMSSKGSFRTAHNCGREAVRRHPEGARS